MSAHAGVWVSLLWEGTCAWCVLVTVHKYAHRHHLTSCTHALAWLLASFPTGCECHLPQCTPPSSNSPKQATASLEYPAPHRPPPSSLSFRVTARGDWDPIPLTQSSAILGGITPPGLSSPCLWGGLASPVTSRAQMWGTSSLEHGAIDVPSVKCHRAKGQALCDFSHPPGSRALRGLAHQDVPRPSESHRSIQPPHAGPGRPVKEKLLHTPVVPEAPWAGLKPGHAARGSANPSRRRGVSGLEWAWSVRDPEPHRTPHSRLLARHRIVRPRVER